MKNSNMNKYKLALGLAALTLLAGAAGCGDDAWDEPVGEEGDDLFDPAGCLGNGCPTLTNNSVELSAESQLGDAYPVQLAGFKVHQSDGMSIHGAPDLEGFDAVDVTPGTDTSVGNLHVKLERRGSSALPAEFVGIFDDFVRARSTDDDLANGVTMHNLNFYFSGDLTLTVAFADSSHATYEIDDVGFAQQHIGSKNVWWIGLVSEDHHGNNQDTENIEISRALVVDAVNVNDSNDIIPITIAPRSNSSDRFDLSVPLDLLGITIAVPPCTAVLHGACIPPLDDEPGSP